MPGDSADPLRVPRKPAWLDESTYRAMEQCLHRQAAFGRDAQRIKAAVRDVALAHYPAAPMPLQAETLPSRSTRTTALAACCEIAGSSLVSSSDWLRAASRERRRSN